MLMGSILIFVCLVACVYYYLFFHRKKALLKKMYYGFDIVKIGVFGRLTKKFESQYGKDKADLFAAAVTNELFYERSSEPKEEKFPYYSKEAIWNEIRNLMESEEIQYIVSQAIRVKAVIFYARKSKVNDEFVRHLEKLKELGWSMPSEAPSPNNFLPKAYEFYNSTPK